ncbi:MAG: multiheme c-type cytochrome [Pseudomonadota bacterium]|nr:multiheme c-type cytochrome [Pseudomonadota bacterium]
MIEGLRAEGPVVVVDAGNLFAGKAVIRAEERDQQVAKARLLAQAYALAGVDAMLPGAGDLALGLPTVRELATAHTLPYVAANLECGGERPFPAYLHFERGGQSFTVVGVMGNSQKEPTCHVTEPAAAVRAALEAAPADVVIVLSGQKLQEDEALAAAFPSVSLVVNGQERQQLEQPRALANGGLLLSAGSRGKQLGVMAFTLTPGATVWRDGQVLARLAEQRDSYRTRVAELKKRQADATDDASRARLGKQVSFFDGKLVDLEASLKAAADESGPAHRATNRLVDLGAELADHPATATLVAAAKALIEAAEPVVTESAIAAGPFAGSSACTGCHADQAKQWGGTAHASAWATLVKTNNERDRACFSCHVTGALHPDGPKDPGAVAGLESVGCEACHGPGKAHVANPPTVEMIAKPAAELCAGCHDGKQDGGRFDPASYLPQVVH